MQRPVRRRRRRASIRSRRAEELDPQRLAAGGREDIHKTASTAK
jgi:hypothetical protein